MNLIRNEEGQYRSEAGKNPERALNERHLMPKLIQFGCLLLIVLNDAIELGAETAEFPLHPPQ
jgi:hypothetical protein